MNVKALPLCLVLGCGVVTGASAETILVGDQVSVASASVALPARGSTQATVEAKFGAPVERHATVGKPPITRWDYAGFSVFFERDRVIHAVATSPAAPAAAPPAN
jgi:hypothetical protein